MNEDSPQPRTLFDYHQEKLSEEREGREPGSDQAYTYRAYFASALTNLSPEDKQKLSELRKRVEAACNDCDIGLYVPAEETDPVEHAEIPASEVFHTDRVQVSTSDLLVLVGKTPSFGAGMEVEIARNALVPFVVILPEDQKLSRMVLGTPTIRQTIRYSGLTEVRERLREAIRLHLSPIFDEVRKAKMFATRQLLGSNIRNERMRRGLSLQELSDMVGISRLELERIEQEPVEVANPSFILVSRVAQVLGLPPAALLNPDLESSYARLAMEAHGDIDEALVGAREVAEMSDADRSAILERVEAAVHRMSMGE